MLSADVVNELPEYVTPSTPVEYDVIVDPVLALADTDTETLLLVCTYSPSNLDLTADEISVLTGVFEIVPTTALWKKHRHTLADELVGHKELKVVTELSVVAHFCFLKLPEVFVSSRSLSAVVRLKA